MMDEKMLELAVELGKLARMIEEYNDGNVTVMVKLTEPHHRSLTVCIKVDSASLWLWGASAASVERSAREHGFLPRA